MKKLRNIICTACALAVLASGQCLVAADTGAPSDLSVNIPASSERYDPQQGIGGFVSRLYTIALHRNYDVDGYNNWCDKLASGELDGANCARGIFYSSEFINKGYDPEQYLTILYRVFFNREPDRGGFEAWKFTLYHGKAYEDVLEDFINSTEWANVCLSYGIRSGGSARPTASVNVTGEIASFVNSLYSDVLGRNADSAGFTSWSRSLAGLEISGKDAAAGFFYSPEFQNRYASMSSTEKVTVFYNVFLGRDPDPAGLSSWVSVIDNGGTLTDLFNGFSDSPEFRARCLACGILPVIADNETISAPINKTYIVPLEGGGITFIRGRFITDEANVICNDTNTYRARAGVASLYSGSDQDVMATRQRAVEISYSFSHTRPNGNSCFSVFTESTYRGENIAYGAFSGSDLPRFASVWRNSPGHYSNMISTTFNYIAAAVFIPEGSNVAYAVQTFHR